MAMMPLRTQYRGPAQTGNFENDIIDESLYFFKANVFFRTYEIKVSNQLITFKNIEITHSSRFSPK